MCSVVIDVLLPQLMYKNGNLGGTSVVEVTPQEAESIRSSRPHDVVTSITLDSLRPFINTSVVILKLDIGKSFRVATF